MDQESIQKFPPELKEDITRLLVEGRRTPDDVVQLFVEEGFDEGTFRSFVEELAADARIQIQAQIRDDLVFGILWIAGGVVAMGIAYRIEFWGAMAYGTYRVHKGATQARRLKHSGL